jgi:hypothetical protein
MLNIYTSGYTGQMLATVYDIYGRIAAQTQWGNSPTAAIQVNNLPPGNYFVQVRNNNMLIATRKIVKE